MKIVFLGTPDFAVPALQAIHAAGFDLVGVVTAPDKPAGRGMKMQAPPVKVAAQALGIPVLQPVKLRDPEFQAALRALEADIQVVIAFRMLPESVWSMPRLGTINLHASLLPDYRGAAPINRVIMNGETRTGLTTFLLKHEVDTGDMIDRTEVDIPDDMTATQLHDRLKELGAGLIVASLRKMASGQYTPIPQGNESSKLAPKLYTADCEIDWHKPGVQIRNQIRGLADYPGAFTHLDGKVLKVFQADFIPQTVAREQIGTPRIDPGKALYFGCSDGWMELKLIQMEGKRKMPVKDFLIGYKSGTV